MPSLPIPQVLLVAYPKLNGFNREKEELLTFGKVVANLLGELLRDLNRGCSIETEIRDRGRS